MDLGAYREFYSMEMIFTLTGHLENSIHAHRFQITLQKLQSGPCKEIMVVVA